MSAEVNPGVRPERNVLAETWCMARAEAKEMFLSIRALFLVITYGGIAGGIGAIVVWLDGKMEGKLAEASQKAAELSATEKASLVEQITKQEMVSQTLAEAIVNGDLPPLVLTILYTSTFAIPILIILVGYNRIAEDVSSRYTRYVLQRIHRGAYLAGKIIGHFLVCFTAVVLVHVLLLGLAKAYDIFDLGRTVQAMPRIWLGMACFVLAYVSYTVMFSSLLQPPFLVLLIASMGLFLIRFLTWVLSFFWAPLGELWLGVWDVRLWALEPAAIGVFLGYAVVFIALSQLALRRRDL